MTLGRRGQSMAVRHRCIDEACTVGGIFSAFAAPLSVGETTIKSDPD